MNNSAARRKKAAAETTGKAKSGSRRYSASKKQLRFGVKSSISSEAPSRSQLSQKLTVNNNNNNKNNGINSSYVNDGDKSNAAVVSSESNESTNGTECSSKRSSVSGKGSNDKLDGKINQQDNTDDDADEALHVCDSSSGRFYQKEPSKKEQPTNLQTFLTETAEISSMSTAAGKQLDDGAPVSDSDDNTVSPLDNLDAFLRTLNVDFLNAKQRTHSASSGSESNDLDENDTHDGLADANAEALATANRSRPANEHAGVVIVTNSDNHRTRNSRNSSQNSSRNGNKRLQTQQERVQSERRDKQALSAQYKRVLQESRAVRKMLRERELERDAAHGQLEAIRRAHMRDAKRARAELDAISAEYMQVMSERDAVHKEMEAMHEQLCKYRERELTATTSGAGPSGVSASASFDVADRAPLELAASTRVRRSRAAAELGQLLDFVGERKQLVAEIEQLTQQLASAEQRREERQHPESASSRSGTMLNGAQQPLSTAATLTTSSDHEQQQLQLSKLWRELHAAKTKREQALSERDRVLRERESIRGLCDELRNQRDHALANLTESLRQADELRKQKALAFHQIEALE